MAVNADGPQDAGTVFCPACGSRNKFSWEFCVRCGEDLTAASAGAVGAAEEELSAPVPEQAPASVSEGPATIEIPVRSLVFWAVLIVLSFAISRSFRPEQDAAAAKMLFSVDPPPTPAARKVAGPPTSAAELFQHGRRLLEQGDTPGALSFIGEAVELEPSNAVFHHGYARALWMAGSTSEALDEYERAARLAPETPQVYAADFGRALRRAGRPADAVKEFDEVLAKSPDNVEILRELGSLLSETGVVQRSVELLRRASTLRPTDLGLMLEVGNAQQSNGDLQAAAESYRRILASHSGASVVRGQLAETLLRAGKNDEAVSTLEQGLSSKPDSARLRLTLASVLERIGRHKDAITQYREYARVAPSPEDARAMEARAAELERRLADSPSSGS